MLGLVILAHVGGLISYITFPKPGEHAPIKKWISRIGYCLFIGFWTWIAIDTLIRWAIKLVG